MSRLTPLGNLEPQAVQVWAQYGLAIISTLEGSSNYMPALHIANVYWSSPLVYRTSEAGFQPNQSGLARQWTATALCKALEVRGLLEGNVHGEFRLTPLALEWAWDRLQASATYSKTHGAAFPHYEVIHDSTVPVNSSIE